MNKEDEILLEEALSWWNPDSDLEITDEEKQKAKELVNTDEIVSDEEFAKFTLYRKKDGVCVKNNGWGALAGRLWYVDFINSTCELVWLS